MFGFGVVVVFCTEKAGTCIVRLTRDQLERLGFIDCVNSCYLSKTLL